MKRNMEVMRQILRAVQDKNDLSERQMTFDDVDDITAARRLELLVAAGYVDAIVSQTIGSPIPIIYVKDLTREGHEFAGALPADETT